jgi:hypothetical protein
MDILLETKILQTGFQKKKTLENKYEIKIILPSTLYYEPLSYFKIILNIQRNIRKLIDGDTSNLNYLKYVNFLNKSNFVGNYPDSKSYFNLPQQPQQSQQQQPQQSQQQQQPQHHNQLQKHHQSSQQHVSHQQSPQHHQSPQKSNNPWQQISHQQSQQQLLSTIPPNLQFPMYNIFKENQQNVDPNFKFEDNFDFLDDYEPEIPINYTANPSTLHKVEQKGKKSLEDDYEPEKPIDYTAIATISHQKSQQEQEQEKARLAQSLKRNFQAFFKGDKFKHIHNGKTGTVANLRDNEYEQTHRISDPSHYYYNVNFDDGSIVGSTYVSQDDMIKLPTY